VVSSTRFFSEAMTEDGSTAARRRRPEAQGQAAGEVASAKPELRLSR